MPKKCKKSVKFDSRMNIEVVLKNLSTRVKDQNITIGREPPNVYQIIVNFIHQYGEFKTILNLSKLWSPSDITRAKGIPRPQNAYILYRKDVSKGLCKANIKMTVCECSKAATYLWRNLDAESKKFWYQLSSIAKVKHQDNYPNYRYNPKYNVTAENKEDLIKVKNNNNMEEYDNNFINSQEPKREDNNLEMEISNVNDYSNFSDLDQNQGIFYNIIMSSNIYDRPSDEIMEGNSYDNYANLDFYNFNLDDYNFSNLLDPLLLEQ